MMKIFKITLLISILLLSIIGCKRIEPSYETGAGPNEYIGAIQKEQIIKENQTLKEQLAMKSSELEKIQNENSTLSRNNEIMITKLEETEKELEIFQNGEVPNFVIEQSDRNSIISYLNYNKKQLDENYRDIQLINSEKDNEIIFYTTGYIKDESQVFIWEVGKEKPQLIEEATFKHKDGWKYLVKDKYILLSVDDVGEKRVLDIENRKIIDKFKSKTDVYLLPNTTSIFIQKEDNFFAIHDFISLTTTDIRLNNNSLYTNYTVEQDGEVIFKGVYNEGYIEYELKAKMSIDKIKELYEIKEIEEDDKSNTGKTVNI